MFLSFFLLFMNKQNKKKRKKHKINDKQLKITKTDYSTTYKKNNAKKKKICKNHKTLKKISPEKENI